MTKALILDVESTGLDEPQVIEYGAMPVWFTQGGILGFSDIHVSRHMPTKPISAGAMGTHGIIEEDLVGCPPFSLEQVGFECEYLIGHGIDYDWKALGEPDVKRIDTLAFSRHLWPELDSHKLMAMVFHIDRQEGKRFFAGAHSVSTDVQAAAFLLIHILAEIGKRGNLVTDMATLWGMSEFARIPTIIGFGKHKGTAIKDLPSDYCQWYQRQAETDQCLIKAMQKAGKI